MDRSIPHQHRHVHGPSLLTDADDRASGFRRPLAIALVLVLAFVGIQATAGLLTGSLALLSDAGHMATDTLGLAIALAAVHFARRRSTARRHTFGLYRLEIIAAAANAVLLLGVGAYVLVEALIRIGRPVEIDPIPVLIVGGGGLVINLICFFLLRRGAGESINVRGAYLEVVADMLGSVGVVTGAIVMSLTGWVWVDAVVAAGIGIFIVPRAVRLGLDAVRILLQEAPAGLDLAAVARDLASVDSVEDVHDLHAWTLTSDMDVLTAHLAVEHGSDPAVVLANSRRLLEERYEIEHSTLQIEPAHAARCTPPSWCAPTH